MRFKRAIACGSAILAMLTGCAANENSSSITITVSDGWSAKHPIGAGATQPFLKYLREHADAVGLKIEYFPAGQLGKQKDAPTLLRTGAVDIAPVIPAYLSTEIPLASVSELPGLVDDACVGINAYMPMAAPGGLLYETQFKKQGVLPLWGVLIPGYEIFTGDRKITGPKDLAGLLIRSTGGVGDRIVRGLGAAPVSLAAPDLYEAVARKTVSGAVLTQLSVTSYSLEEVLHHSTSGARLGTTTVLFAMGDKMWDRLSEAQRNVLRDASKVAQTGGCKSIMKANENAAAEISAAGVQVTEIAGDVRSAWDADLVSVREGWVRDLTSVGLPAAEALRQFEARLDAGSHE